MAGCRHVPAGGGEIIGDAPDRRVAILSDDGALNATWSRFGPGREGADLHVHREHSDLFYVLAGEVTVRLGPEDATVAVPAGTLARVPPLVVHGFRNASDGEMRYLNFHAPGRRFADYLRAVRDGREFAYDQHPPPADGGRSPAEAAVGGATAERDEPGVRVTLHADMPEIAVREVEAAGLAGGAPATRGHLRSLYVLDGELVLAADGGIVRGGAGSWLQVPAGVPHALAATGDVRFLDVSAPAARPRAVDAPPARRGVTLDADREDRSDS